MLKCKAWVSKDPEYLKKITLPSFIALNFEDFENKVKAIREKFYLFPYLWAQGEQNNIKQ